MLVNIDTNTQNDHILSMVAQVNGNHLGTNHITQGVYTIGHFNPEDVIAPHINYTEVWSGVVDKVQDIKKVVDYDSEFEEPSQFFIIMTPVVKSNQSEDGGWRWHKWGEYIGEGEPQHEYLFDEAEGEFETIFVARIYEKEV